jgi:hypothetical protein
MSALNPAAGFERRRTILSTLWIFAVLNYIYADVYTLFFGPALQPEVMRRFAEGYVGDIPITQGFVLFTAVLMQTAIVMVLLSRVLPYRANRWANIVSAAFHTLFVAWSLEGSSVNWFYAFFVAVEAVTTVFIVWYAWKWPAPSREPAPGREMLAAAAGRDEAPASR